MGISENLQRVFAIIITVAFLLAMVLEWRSGFKNNYLTHPVFWILVGPLILINTHAVTSNSKISKETRQMLLMMLLLSLTIGLTAIVLSYLN